MSAAPATLIVTIVPVIGGLAVLGEDGGERIERDRGDSRARGISLVLWQILVLNLGVSPSSP
jgi:hypothetical protein